MNEFAEFIIKSNYEMSPPQRECVKKLSDGLRNGYKTQTLKGVTGCGKTFIMANIIKEIGRPVLILSHNKTLAAQLFREFKNFFPQNAVEYFVSTYDYYQPEAYVPGKDLYIEKEVDLNDEIDRLRMHASFSLLERRDVIVVSTVSCIYGLGSPQALESMIYIFSKNTIWDTSLILHRLVQMQYSSNQNGVLERGQFAIKGDSVDIFPGYLDNILHIDIDFDNIEKITIIDPVSRKVIEEVDEYSLYPAKQFVMPKESVDNAIELIKEELKDRLEYFNDRGQVLEAQRLKSRVEYDLDMLSEIGYVSGIENYSRHLMGRPAGSRPSALLDYFPDDFLTFIDESHVTLPQIGAMYEGDRSRKQNLVDYGFRLPSALDNRPLKYSEFDKIVNDRIYVSATPGEREVSESRQIVEQIIRPTGLLDPIIHVRPTENQIDDILKEIKNTLKKSYRVLITTLTKKMAEDLSAYLKEKNIKVAYLHSEIDTIERVNILKDLRCGKYDVLVGINLLREGLDLPEVALILILDADKIGFLRSETSLIQIIGRAARNEDGLVIMYADTMSLAMKSAIEETRRRRTIQEEYNKEHGIIPHSVKKDITDILEMKIDEKSKKDNKKIEDYNLLIPREREKYIKLLEKEMQIASKNLEFEKAIALRDTIRTLRNN